MLDENQNPIIYKETYNGDIFTISKNTRGNYVLYINNHYYSVSNSLHGAKRQISYLKYNG